MRPALGSGSPIPRVFDVAHNRLGDNFSFPENPMLRAGGIAAPTFLEYPMTRVLIVNDDATARRDLAAFLASPRFEVVESSSASEATHELASREFDVVLSASPLTEGDAVATFTAARSGNPALSVLLIAGTLDSPFGAKAPPPGFELLTKPLHPEPVRTAVDRAAERGRLQRENASLKDELRELRGALGEPNPAGGHGNGSGDGSTASTENRNGNGHALRDWIASLPESFDLRSLEAEVERELVKRALASSAGVAAQAARKLGLSRSDLAYKIRRLGIVRERLGS